MLKTINMSINWNDWELIRKADGKEHEFVLHKLTKEKKFVKFLRENGQFRFRELISELVSGEIFNRFGLGLNPLLVTKNGKPAIMMDRKEDARLLNLAEPYVIDKIELKEYSAASLFILDRLLKNTNREMRLDHLGWESLDNGKIKISSFDNGQTLGHGGDDNSLDDDIDLDANINELYNKHLSFKISPGISPQTGEQILSELKNTNFEEICSGVRENIIDILAPTDDEKDFLNVRISKISTMLTRRLPKLEVKVSEWLGINVVQTQILQEEQPQVN